MPLTVEIIVRPQAVIQRCVLDRAGRIKCQIAAPPEKGRANAALIKFIAGALNIPKEDVSIVLGKSSRHKRVRIEHDITREQLLYALGIEEQCVIGLGI